MKQLYGRSDAQRALDEFLTGDRYRGRRLPRTITETDDTGSTPAAVILDATSYRELVETYESLLATYRGLVAVSAQGSQPRRGDDFEAWLKAHRDAFPQGCDLWVLIDTLLNDYRLRADVGAPLVGDAPEER